MATPCQVCLQRADMREPWGFRLQGGRDFRMQLSVKKIQNGSPADGYLHNGDAILAIGGNNAQNLTHMQAHQLIKSAAGALQLTILKGHLSTDGIDKLKPKGPVKFSPWKGKRS